MSSAEFFMGHALTKLHHTSANSSSAIVWVCCNTSDYITRFTIITIESSSADYMVTIKCANVNRIGFLIGVG
jgi:hypothetical protein